MDAAFAIPDHSPANGSNLPKAVDLSHHLNLLARSRKANTLKGLYQYAGRPGMIALAGGMPPPEFFPFETLEAEIMTFDSKPKTAPSAALASAKESKATSTNSLFSWLFNKPTKTPTQHISVPKYNSGKPGTVDLASLLQYSSAQGNPALLAFIREFSEKAYGPAYADWEVLLNIGATQGWNMVVNLLCERGDPILVEEFTYPGAMNAYVPLGCPKIPIAMDGEGIIPSALEKILSEWDVEARGGMKRPTLFYTIPTGQNPTGATMLAKRKMEVYEILVKYDIILVEDDPYFWLGGDPWVPQAGQKAAEASLAAAAAANGGTEVEKFIASVAPSYLKFDYQGRVIRLDTFSKTIAPGSRLGWFTCNPLFAERLLRATESSAQAPSGYGQAMVTTLLTTWKFDGYIRWLQGIQATYSMRRDWMCDLFEEIFHLEFDKSLKIGGSKFVGIEAFERVKSGSSGVSVMDEKRGFKSKKALLSFVPPSAGMFIWLKLQPESFSAYHSLCAAGDPEPEVTFMEVLWKELADHNVLVSPGTFFDGRSDVAPLTGGQVDTAGYFRLSFSIATHEQQRVAIQAFHDILSKWAK